MPLAERKGIPVRILSKKYKKCPAWRDTNHSDTRCKVHVIIEYEPGKLRGTLINKENVADDYPEPTSYEEAALQQIDQIDYAMDHLCKLLSEANIQSGEEITRIFSAKLDRATIIQFSKGTSAKWFQVNYTSEWNDHHDGGGPV